MAVYQGTRPPAAVLPVGARPVTGRRSRRTTDRAERRIRPVGLVLATILIAFLVGLVYLTQTLRSAVTSYQTNTLDLERRALTLEQQSQRGEVARWGSEPIVVQWAQQHGLDRLGGTIRVPSR